MIRVLIADDQRVNRVLLRRCLDPERYTVEEAENGREALERFDEARPDVVLLDVMMPELDGFETAREMKARQGDDYVPIIMVTSLADEESLRQGMEAGADDFVPKPFNRVVLESKLKASLRTRGVFRTLASKNEELRSLHEQAHAEQVMAEKLMAGVLRTGALGHPMFRYRSAPMDVFNGDLLLAAEGPEGRMRFMLGDFSGHGLAAAIGGLPVVVHFEEVCRKTEALADVAAHANAELREVLPRDRFLAAVLVDYDPSARVAEVLNLGMPPVLLRRAAGGCEAIPSSFLPLGVLESFDARELSHRVRLEPGDRLFIYSDGVNEAENAEGEVFGEVRLLELVQGPGPGAEVFERVLARLDAFVGEAPAGDDVTFFELDPDAPAEAMSPPSSEAKSPDRTTALRWQLTPELLRSCDPLRVVEALLEGLAPLEGRRAEVFAIVAEMLNNAVDHGLLGLDSNMKADIEGFGAFYEERARRIETTQDGHVEVELGLERDGEGWRLDIAVEDTGEGFDVPTDVPIEVSPDQAHGRGVSMIVEMCESVRFRGRGNRVEAVYRWIEDADQSTSRSRPTA